MKIGITGASGFIGNHLMRRLIAEGHRPIAFLQPDIPCNSLLDIDGSYDTAIGDITDEDSVRRFAKQCDVIIHLAGYNRYWSRNRNVFYHVNVIGTQNLVKASLISGVKKLIHVSSCITLGASEFPILRNEESPFNLRTINFEYARTKRLGEEVVKSAIIRQGLPAVVVHPVSTIGERDHGPTPIGRAILDICGGSWPVYVAGGACFIDVRDVARGLLLAAEKGRVGQSYILAGQNMTNQQFMSEVSRCAGIVAPKLMVPTSVVRMAARSCQWLADHITGKEPAITDGMAALVGKFLYFSSAKAEVELGFTAGSAVSSIERCVDWFRSINEIRSSDRSNRIYWPAFGGKASAGKASGESADSIPERAQAS